MYFAEDLDHNGGGTGETMEVWEADPPTQQLPGQPIAAAPAAPATEEQQAAPAGGPQMTFASMKETEPTAATTAADAPSKEEQQAAPAGGPQMEVSPPLKDTKTATLRGGRMRTAISGTAAAAAGHA
eukprot:SAG31_NODE_23942_length_492_cov_1.195929_1_plen_126_part_01